MSDRIIPPETREKQATASDPKNSAWVSANAGSGKTHVLAQRVIRLLLDDVDPSRILCLTYTKAAAANMSNRIFKNLAGWAVMSDEKLSSEIAEIDGQPPKPARLARARRLFARALETPGGLKIQTIHAFCEAVLHQFPLEANIAGHFDMLDGQKEQALVAEARRDVLTGVAAGDNPELTAALEHIIALAGESGLDNLLNEIVGKRDALKNFISEAGVDYVPLYAEFGFDPSDDAVDLAQSIWPDSYFTAGLAKQMSDRAASAGKLTAGKFADSLAHAAKLKDPLARLKVLDGLFVKLDEDKNPIARPTKSIMAKGVAEHFPDFEDEFVRYAGELAGIADRVALLGMLHATRAALTLADVLIGRYEHMKAARGLLDFNDLITRTVRLLARPDVGPWVAFKLDRGIDHILVDEAQDTSPVQWDVVGKLAAEFFVGAGARGDINRTIFAVGDEKQSIYSFQGADPRSFRMSGDGFRKQVTAAGGNFTDVSLQHSFRSTLDVLSAVDLVFGSQAAAKGLTGDPEPIMHPTVRTVSAGHVELWPLEEPTQVDEPDDWAEAIDHAAAPAVVLAERIADTIDGWLKSGSTIGQKEGAPRRIRPGDVLVLVRKRDRFIHALTRALKDRLIAVAGADRLSLTGHIAVKDLIAIGRVAMQPNDDLSLAALLRSPVFAVSEDRLFELAWKRKGSLLDELRKRADEDVETAKIVATLDRWTNEAAWRPVFEFYGGVLARDGVRSLMVARLGASAGEILDEFQNFTLAVEQTGSAGLEAFLATLESASPDVKREVDQTRDEVRIMTVHAAKGLEAPVVFLVDSAGAPSNEMHVPRLMPVTSSAGQWHGPGFLWRPSSDLANKLTRGISRKLRDAAEDEYRRLLYVGMTRAEERLVVCGYRGKLTPKPDIWHSLVEAGLAPSQYTSFDAGTGVLTYRVNPPHAAAEIAVSSAQPESPGYPPLPPLPEAAQAKASLSPSAASALLDPPAELVVTARSPVFDPGEEPSFAIARGSAIHRLLQVLPGLDAPEREAAGLRYLATAGSGWSEAERDRAWQSVDAVLSDPQFAPVFAAGSRAEVTIAGTLPIGGQERTVSGMIDRLAVTPAQVLCIDYKTNAVPPQSPAEVPQAYVVQMALYRALLAGIYPGREIRSALLFTETPQLIELPVAMLDDALERLSRA